MIGKFKFIFLMPFFLAIDCEDDYVCNYEEPEAFVVNVENTSATYAAGETLWLNSEISSVLFNNCTNEDEMVTDNSLFRDGFFLLKLENNLIDLNSEVFSDYSITYAVGEEEDFQVCSNAIAFLPELSEDNMLFKYRLGIAVNGTGDFCLVNAYNNAFNSEQENNAEIFNAYDTLENRIRFENCQDIYTRLGTDGFYFFRVE